MFVENVLLSALKKFDDKPYKVRLNGKEYLIGSGDPLFTVALHKKISLSTISSGNSFSLGEAYMRGDIDFEGDMYTALDYFLGQMKKIDGNDSMVKRLMHDATTRNQKKVQLRYDTGSDFYKMWLDDTMSYSCGYFWSEEDTLTQAQINKTNYILKNLDLKEGMSLLDLGCGWGFLLMEAARKYKIKGTGIALNDEQYRAFSKKIKEEQLEDQLTVLRMDYQDLPQSGLTFDRAVSVGMVEQIGRDNDWLLMECVKKVLKPDGLFLLHFMNQRKKHPGDPLLRKYIFPGDMIRSPREMLSLAKEYDMNTMDVRNLRSYYYKTLLYWNQNFRDHMDEMQEVFDEPFLRMWNLHLAAGAATFHNEMFDMHQILFTN